MTEAARWTAAKFGGVAERPPEAPPGLVVLANNDPVQRNARGGRPLRIVNAEFTRGLYCHAYSKLIVRLPGPGDVFTAVAGVDSNEQTREGRGSVRFAVLVGGAEAFKSAVLREGMAGVPVNVKLDGVRDFILQVDDAGDGIGCDQADWADAKVKLQDGREIWLADLPLGEGTGRPPFTTEPPFSFKFGGKMLADLAWQPARSTRQLDAARTEHTLRYAKGNADGQTGRRREPEGHVETLHETGPAVRSDGKRRSIALSRRQRSATISRAGVRRP